MILQALCDYYRRLAEAPEKLARPGFTEQQISFEVVLEADGTLHEFHDLRDTDSKPVRKRAMKIPGPAKPSGTRLNPNFIWDNTGYMLGYKADDEKPERTTKSFEAFRKRHLDARKDIQAPEYSALCTFLEDWEPEQAAEHEVLADVSGGFGVFRIRGRKEHLHQVPEIEQYALRQADHGREEEIGQCLVTGKNGPLARLHEPKIKGVHGAQSSGAAIVSFNRDAFRSYGKKQSYNAPVSKLAAFEYCTALNHLLRHDSTQRVRIGDATVVCWADRPMPIESLFGTLIGGPEDETVRAAAVNALKRLRNGEAVDLGETSTPFYVLGLSASAKSRISVRFWFVSTVGEFTELMTEHARDIELVYRRTNVSKDGKPAWTEDVQMDPPLIHAMLDETVVAKNGWPDRDRIPERLAGDMFRAIMTASPFPEAFWHAVLERARIEGLVDPDKRKDAARAKQHRIAILKACLLRQYRSRSTSTETFNMVYLNKLHPEPAYHAGRLMGLLEFIQQQALGNVNATLAKRYLSAVSSAPGLHLGRLQVLAEKAHVPKLHSRQQQRMRDEIMQINSQFRDGLPTTLTPEGCTFFMIGYYQEYQDLQAKKASNEHTVRTTMGDWVRSKGECQVANALASLGVAYCYEPYIAVRSGPYRIPDFLIPEANASDQVFIEYLGLAGDEEYDARWQTKLKAYEESGITVEGGERGRLVVIDAREKNYDDSEMISLLCKELKITPRAQSTQHEQD